jgi:hypothetical protein
MDKYAGIQGTGTGPSAVNHELTKTVERDIAKSTKDMSTIGDLKGDLTATEEVALESGREAVFNEQCFLLGMAKSLRENIGSLFQNDGPTKDFLNTAASGHMTSLVGDPALLVNNLTVNREIVAAANASSLELSQLSPEIRIFKIFPGGVETEYPFPNSVDFAGFTKEQKAYRGDGAGIKDFSYDLDGQNPAKKFLVQAKLKLFFQDVKTLFKPFKTSSGSQKFTYSDLIRYPGRDNPLSSKKSNFFRIRVTLGWSYNGDSSILSPSLKKLLKQTQVHLVLDYKNHKLEFREDGAVSLDIEYAGAIESAMGGNHSPFTDILGNLREKADQRYEQMQVFLAEIDKERKAVAKHAVVRAMREKLNTLAKNIKESKTSSAEMVEFEYLVHEYAPTLGYGMEVQKSVADLAKSYMGLTEEDHRRNIKENTARNIKELNDRHENLKKQVNRAREQTFRLGVKKYLETLFDNDLVYYMNFTKFQQNAWREIQKRQATWTTREAAAGHQVLYNDIHKGFTGGDRVGTSRASEGAQVSKMAANGSMATGGFTAAAMASRGEVGEEAIKTAHVDLATGQWVSHIDGTKKLKFFFFGSLLDAMLANMGDAVQKNIGNFRMLVGPMIFTHPITQKTSHISISDIPVSVEMFNYFLVDKIIGQGQKTYQFIQFIQDFVQFIMNSVLGQCGPGSKNAANNVKLDFITVSTPLDKPLAAGRLLYSPDTVKLIIKPGARTKDLQNVFLLYGSEGKLDKLTHTTKFLDNIRQGIFHFFVGGQDGGLLKSINFIEESQKKFATAQWQKTQQGGQENKSGLIRAAKLKIKLRLIGNSFFYIGQKIYVDTRLIDGGYFVRENLPVGGYYIVTRVNNYLSDEKYETDLEAILNVDDRSLAEMPAKDAHTPLNEMNSAGISTNDPAHIRAAKVALATRKKVLADNKDSIQKAAKLRRDLKTMESQVADAKAFSSGAGLLDKDLRARVMKTAKTAITDKKTLGKVASLFSPAGLLLR